MAKNVKERNALRDAYMAEVMKAFTENGEDVLRVASNRIAFPVVGCDKGEYFVTVTVAIPTGERGGEPYDGYAHAEEYAIKCKSKAEKSSKK